MKRETLMASLAYVDDALLESAADSMVKPKKRISWKSWVAMAACLALVAGLFFYHHQYIPTVPKYENALFSAQQIGELFSEYKLNTMNATNEYNEVAYPPLSLFAEPLPPQTDALPIYCLTGQQPSRSELEDLVARVYPKLEEMYGMEIPVGEIEADKFSSPSYNDYYYTESEFGIWCVQGSTSWKNLNIWWHNQAFTPLMINGTTLQIHTEQTDQQIMDTISPVIPYLEEIFDLELSGHKLVKSYYSGNGSLDYLSVYLYNADHITEPLLEQFTDRPNLACSGDMICLEFRTTYNNDPTGTVECRSMRYVASLQHRQETYAQCRMISLSEAEALLANGYVFAGHGCRLCIKEQDHVDFTFYDHVSLEYVYEDHTVSSYGIPFYTFYKKIEEKDGVVIYAKTMVPAIEVSGLEEYFSAQEQYHSP